jgi:hypothetical protein
LVILEMGSCDLLAWGWPWTSSLPISASQVARITGMIHRYLASKRQWSTYSKHFVKCGVYDFVEIKYMTKKSKGPEKKKWLEATVVLTFDLMW